LNRLPVRFVVVKNGSHVLTELEMRFSIMRCDGSIISNSMIPQVRALPSLAVK
jgi:hypothetical protein